MPRFHLPPEECQGARLRLRGAEAHHAARVLRLQPGDGATVLDGAGSEFDCVVTEVDRHEVGLARRARRRHPRTFCSVVLRPALTKARSFEWLLQKATELGATEIAPVVTARSVPALAPAEVPRKQAKWRAVMIEAMKQCGNPWLPELKPAVAFRSSLAEGNSGGPALVADLTPGCLPLGEALATAERGGEPPRRVTFWVGPEGDFTPDELAALREAGVTSVSLGPRVLRSETAALYALSVIADRWGRRREPAD